MTQLARVLAQIVVASCSVCAASGSAFAQGAAPAASAAFPPEPAPAATAASTPGAQPATAAPLPTPPAPTYADAAPPAPAYPPPAPNSPAFSSAPPAQSQYGYVAEPQPPAPPPPQRPDAGFERPEISIRVDPFNFLLEGRLGLEIESQIYKALTLEVVPVFVTTQSPPTLNYASYEKSTLRQASNGIGAISGAALDLGIWFGGKPFNGYVLRAGFTNYAYTYNTSFSGGSDSLSHTDRQFFAMIGTHNRWGAFTIAGGFGLAYELNRENRCFDALGDATTSCDKDTLQLKLNDSGSVAELHPFLYPFDLLARFSLGVVF